MLAACPNCEWSDVVGEEFLGQTAECPSCENDFVVQDAETPVAATLKKKKLKVGAKNRTGVSRRRQTPEKAENPYAAPSTSDSLGVGDDGEVIEYGGMRRGAYWGWNIGLNFLALIPILGIFAMIAGTVYIIRERLKNLGYNLWYGWTILIPIYNIVIGLRLGFAPEGYADHKTLDKPAKI